MSTMFNRNSRKGQQLGGERHDGPNWVLIAGGAVVTVISFVIGRRESIISKGGGLEKRKDSPYRMPKPDSKKGIAYIATEGEKRIQTKYNGHQSDSHVVGASSPLTSHFQIHRTKSCKQDVHSTSLPSSPKPFMVSLTTPPCTDEDLQYSSPSPVPLQRVVSEKCEVVVVHRLQQQLKRRDGMIFDLQAQIIDQGHTVAAHKAQIANLEAQLEEKSKILFHSTQEVEQLQRALADQSVRCDACSKDCSGFDEREVVKSLNMEVEMLAGEVKQLEIDKRELAGEVAHLECKKRERELVAQVMSQEHETLVQRIFKLETELEEKKKLEEKLHRQERKLVDADNTNSGGQWGGKNEPHSSRKSRAKALTSRTGMVNSPTRHTRIFCRSATHTHSTALKRSDDKNHPVNKFKAGSKGRQQVKPRNLSNGRVETMTNVTALDPALNEIKFKPPHQDIQQLGTPLAIQLNMVSEPKQEMTRLVDDSQTPENIEDDVKEHMDTMTPLRLNLDKPNWAELSQLFSFSTSATSPAQVKELTHKLEQVAKQQQVEEEMAELKKQQTKIAELRQRVGKLTTKCQLWYTHTNEDKVRDQHMLQVAALVLELADRLAAQEEQESHTSIQEWSNSAEMTPHANGDANQSLSRYIAQDKKPRENYATSLDQPISFTFTEEVTRPATDDAELHSTPSQVAKEPNNFPLATLGHPTSKIQDLFSNGVKKSTSRKIPVGYGSGGEHLSPNSSSDSDATSASHQGQRKYSMPESKPYLGGKSHNTASDQKLDGHQTRSMEEEISLLSLEIEQVMAETSSLPLISRLHQDPRFSLIMKSLAVPDEGPMVAIDSRSSRASCFKQGNYKKDGEFQVDPPHSRGKRVTKDDEEGHTEENEISSRNYDWNPGHRSQMYPDSATPSPFLDLKKASSTTSRQSSETYWEDIPIFPGDSSGGQVLDSNKAYKISIPPKAAIEEETGSPGSSGSSIDSAFNEILEDTLEDLVKVCSVGTSLAGTPASSTFSHGSVTKNVQQHY
ncbi:hypothetical protein CY35_03G018600 [Sphagnum magellanicum]|nr:hypothetical protein CY35_03G018600 [Sphagnum magellanicum]